MPLPFSATEIPILGGRGPINLDAIRLMYAGLVFCSSRTTDLEYSRKPGRNGKTYLAPCVVSHNPLDCVIIMLGTNDLKIEFDRSALQIAVAVNRLIDDIKKIAWNKQRGVPQIIIISPILVNSEALDFKALYPEHYNEEFALKSRQLADELAIVADNAGCRFLDAATVSIAGSDGIHFDEASHPALGELIADYAAQISF